MCVEHPVWTEEGRVTEGERVELPELEREERGEEDEVEFSAWTGEDCV